MAYIFTSSANNLTVRPEPKDVNNIINKYQKKYWTKDAALRNTTLDWTEIWCFIIIPDSLDTIKKEVSQSINRTERLTLMKYCEFGSWWKILQKENTHISDQLYAQIHLMSSSYIM